MTKVKALAVILGSVLTTMAQPSIHKSLFRFIYWLNSLTGVYDRTFADYTAGTFCIGIELLLVIAVVWTVMDYFDRRN